MISFLKSLFQSPQFSQGARVNMVDGVYRFGATKAENIDGRVVTQTEQGVLVEWPRTGTRWMNPEALCLQA